MPNSDRNETDLSWLSGLLHDHGGAAGTVHRVNSGGVLELCASKNIPPKVQELTRAIPRGKGMAGLAWERKAPVSTCNLADDRSGDVRPGARAVQAQAAVALPVFDGDTVRAVVGIAYAGERTLSEAELEQLLAAASSLPARIGLATTTGA